MSIEIANIKKSFGRTQVLNDISLDIPSEIGRAHV